jgi:translation elongation factor 2 (EF-2/EF-G)
MNTRRGRVMGMMPAEGGRTTITAQRRSWRCSRYATDLRSLTQGRGRFSMTFDHYEDVPPHLMQALIEARKKEHNSGH